MKPFLRNRVQEQAEGILIVLLRATLTIAFCTMMNYYLASVEVNLVNIHYKTHTRLWNLAFVSKCVSNVKRILTNNLVVD